ncbi:hypothetical protein OSCI_2500023 [Kamptonema sp. PCC 6506]|nr:hypothetical protein OSCI_2500023 [Kamptonema sp. PCC 6506]
MFRFDRFKLEIRNLRLNPKSKISNLKSLDLQPNTTQALVQLQRVKQQVREKTVKFNQSRSLN